MGKERHEFHLVAEDGPIDITNWRSIKALLLDLQPAESAELLGDPPMSIRVIGYLPLEQGEKVMEASLVVEIERLAATPLRIEDPSWRPPTPALEELTESDLGQMALDFVREKLSDYPYVAELARLPYKTVVFDETDPSSRELANWLIDGLRVLLPASVVLVDLRIDEPKVYALEDPAVAVEEMHRVELFPFCILPLPIGSAFVFSERETTIVGGSRSLMEAVAGNEGLTYWVRKFEEEVIDLIRGDESEPTDPPAFTPPIFSLNDWLLRP